VQVERTSWRDIFLYFSDIAVTFRITLFSDLQKMSEQKPQDIHDVHRKDGYQSRRFDVISRAHKLMRDLKAVFISFHTAP
jgi:hypothetical protein